MIRRSLVVTLVMLTLYSLIVAVLRERPWFFPVEHQWQANLMTAQGYIYESRESKVVIVGSSLSAVLGSGHENFSV